MKPVYELYVILGAMMVLAWLPARGKGLVYVASQSLRYFTVAFAVAAMWMWSYLSSVAAPHVVIRSINGHEISRYTSTNRDEISFTTAERIGTNGFEYYQKPVTNRLW
jgi:hypothetical protein